MRLIFLLTVICWVGCTADLPNTDDLIITNVNLIDGTGNPLQEGVNIHVKHGKIQAIDQQRIGKAQQVIDGTGKYLMPGLFDCHVHTTDFVQDFPRFMHYGVTSVFITGGSTCTNEYYAAMRAMGNQDSLPDPRVYHTSQHFTMEGRHPVKTYASSNWVEGKTVFFLRDTAQIEQLVKQVAQYPIQGIKLTIEDGPAPPFVERIPQAFVDKTVKEAAKYGLEVFAHVSDNEEFLIAVKGGVQNLIHYVGVDIDWEDETHVQAVNTLLEKEASWVTTLMIDKSFIYALHPQWLEVPELNEVYPIEALKQLLTPGSLGKSKRMEGLMKLENGIEEVNLKNIFLPKVADIQRTYDLGLNLVVGTDTGNDFIFPGYSLHEEMQLLELGGMAPLDIIKMGTHNAAIMMNAEDSLGTIEVGKLADMILLDKNPLEDISHALAINKVFKNGKVQKRID